MAAIPSTSVHTPLMDGIAYQAQSDEPSDGGMTVLKVVLWPRPSGRTVLPVVGPRGAAEVSWGRQASEALDLPTGPTVSRVLLDKRSFQRRFDPVFVLIPARKFRASSGGGASGWIQLTDTQALLGVGLRCGGRARVFVLVEPREVGGQVYPRYPIPLEALDWTVPLGINWQPADWPWHTQAANHSSRAGR